MSSKTFTAADAVVLVLRGTDGSRVADHALFHVTVSANQTVTSVIATDELTCRSLSFRGAART